MEYALFEVSLKAIIKRGDSVLTLTNLQDKLDFPGGRISTDEMGTPLEKILLREIREELGDNLTLIVGALRFTSQRTYTYDGVVHNVLCLFCEAIYISGEPVLSDEHNAWEWSKPCELLKDKSHFQSEDEFIQFENHFPN